MFTQLRAPARPAHARLLAAAAIIFVASYSTATLAQSAPFSFGLWGDMPYAKAKDGP